MTIAATLWGIFLQCPSHYFLAMYGDLCIMLIMWARCIEQLESIEDIMKESKHFLNGLNKVATIISSPLFWIITQLQIGLILWVFVSLTIIFFPAQSESGKNVIDILQLCLWMWFQFVVDAFSEWPEFIGNLGNSFGMILQLMFLCKLSEELATEVSNINTKLLKSQSSKGQTDSISSQLEKFKGFSANGYFTVNHSLLTGMTANFVTYMVILIQFQQSTSTP